MLNPLSDGIDVVSMPEPQLTRQHHWNTGVLRKEVGRVRNRPKAHVGYTKQPELLEEGPLEGVSRTKSLRKEI